jgi:DNA mismatch endonuclease, patch repair protein
VWENDFMVDTRTKEKRHEIMSMVRSKDTAPELEVRKLIFAMGYRYRLHVRGLPSKPDIVMMGRRKIIDVRGCFWHGHSGCKYGRLPKSREDFWKTKIEHNRERDTRNLGLLEGDGWRVLVVWQCELQNPDLLKAKLYEFIEAQ